MTEAAGDHRLESLGSGGRVASNHGVGSHDGRDRSRPGVESVSDDLEKE